MASEGRGVTSKAEERVCLPPRKLAARSWTSRVKADCRTGGEKEPNPPRSGRQAGWRARRDRVCETSGRELLATTMHMEDVLRRCKEMGVCRLTAEGRSERVSIDGLR